MQKFLRIAGFTLGIVTLGVVSVLFFAFIGIGLAVAIPAAIIASVIRSAIQDFRGTRPEHTPGVIDVEPLREPPKSIRHFADEA